MQSTNHILNILNIKHITTYIHYTWTDQIQFVNKFRTKCNKRKCDFFNYSIDDMIVMMKTKI